MVTQKGGFESEARIMTFSRAQEPTERSTRNVVLGWKPMRQSENIKQL
jgi:hypothetical protein